MLMIGNGWPMNALPLPRKRCRSPDWSAAEIRERSFRGEAVPGFSLRSKPGYGLMRDAEDRRRVAAECIAFAQDLAS
jgi:hypothetical protein